MSIIGQQIAYSKFLKENKKLVDLVDNHPEVYAFSVIPYNERGKEITQEMIDSSKNPFLLPNHPSYLIHLNTSNPSEKLKQQIIDLENLDYKELGIKLFLLKPTRERKIASMSYYFNEKKFDEFLKKYEPAQYRN